MKYVSVCSGIEAATNAWHKFGWTPVAFSEIEPFPAAVLKHRFPNTPNYGDLTQYKSWPIEPGSIDLLVGGTPCQSFSVAGLRKGLADPRGNLCLTFLGLADHLRPRWILWENVVGVLSSGGGRDFGSFLGALGQLGYGWAYRILNAEHFGVPQRRRRVFVLAYRDPVTGTGDWRVAAEALSVGEGLQRYLEKGKPSRKKPAADVAEGAGANGGDGAGQPGGAGVGAGCWWDGGQVSQTLDAVLAKRQTMPDKNRFPAVLQPVVIDRAAFNQGENAQYEPHIGESEVMDTVVARGPHAVGIPPMMFKIRGGSPTETGEQGGTPGKVAGKGFLGSEDKAFTVATSQDQWLAQPVVAPTVTTCKGSKGGCSDEAIAEIAAIHLAQQAIPIQDGREIEKKQNGIGVGQPGDPAYTLDTTGAQAVGQPIDDQKKGRREGGAGLVSAVPFRKSKRAQSEQDDETWVADEKANTLNCFDQGDTRTTHAVVEPKAFILDSFTSNSMKSNNPHSGCREVEQTKCLDTSCLNPACHQGGVMITHPVVDPIAIQGTIIGRSDNAGPQGTGATEGGPMFTLTKTDIHAVAHIPQLYENHAQDSRVTGPLDVAPTVAAKFGTGGGNVPMVSSQPVAFDAPTMVVRRLSVNECLRLQGFPDNWTNIPWKGKPEGQAPDGPQYKCAGNSMAVPCMSWIAEGIIRVEAKLKAKG
jgi:DNA-cytosine methyltransferase